MVIWAARWTGSLSPASGSGFVTLVPPSLLPASTLQQKHDHTWTGHHSAPGGEPRALAAEGIDGRAFLLARHVGHRAKRVFLTLDEAGFGQHIKGHLGLAG